MTGRRIVVVSPRTWGQFGNYLAATRLAGVIADQLPGDDVVVWEAESTLPWVGEIGGRMAQISQSSPDPVTRSARYLDLIAEVEREHPAGFEVDDESPVRAKMAGLREAFEQERPDLVVSTKGFTARLCKAAMRDSGLDVPVAAYVTNPGLLELALHRSPHLDAVLVPFDWTKDHLLRATEVRPESVHVVGPLVAQRDLGAFVEASNDPADQTSWPDDPSAADRPRIILFSNRGGDDYHRMLRHLADRHPYVDVTFVGYHDESLVNRAAGGEDVPARWRFHTRLTQQQYFGYMEGAAAAQDALLLSKAGPNTTLEAAYFGIPVLMLRSGLPMESWVDGLIEENRLGRCCGDVDELLPVLDDWLADRTAIRAHREACRRFADTALNQKTAAERIGRVVRGLLDPETAIATAGRPRRGDQ
ncbi:hypothetical protein AB0F49_00150 [Micromonospora ureilytica]|uniref:hypothetical protein n=1 Tax=Micromonospora ureilytica TaxID=709868 RepID=UPI0033E12638